MPKEKLHAITLIQRSAQDAFKAYDDKMGAERALWAMKGRLNSGASMVQTVQIAGDFMDSLATECESHLDWYLNTALIKKDEEGGELLVEIRASLEQLKQRSDHWLEGMKKHAQAYANVAETLNGRFDRAWTMVQSHWDGRKIERQNATIRQGIKIVIGGVVRAVRAVIAGH